MVKIISTLLLASIACAADAGNYTVRVRNLTFMQPFSAPLVVAHTRDVALFNEGQPAVAPLKLMAEEGDNSGLLELAASESVAPFVCGAAVAEASLLPGETWRGLLEVDTDICGNDGVLTVLGMLVNSNDAFVGIDSIALESASKIYPPAFDAGTETNNELCANIPGPACNTSSGNVEAGPGEGFIHVHRGVHGIGDIAENTYDWRNPVAEVFVFAR